MQGEGGARLSATDPTAAAPARSRRRVGLFLTVAALWYAADLATKGWALATLTDSPPRDLLGTFLRLQLVHNPGAAFSLGTGSTWLLTVVAVVVVVALVRTSRRLGSTGWAWALGMIFGGALGNLTDRLIREPGFGRGQVVDFIDYNGYFIGNVADIAIVSAAVLIVLLALLGIGLEGRHEGGPAGVEGAAEVGRDGIPVDGEAATHDG